MFHIYSRQPMVCWRHAYAVHHGGLEECVKYIVNIHLYVRWRTMIPSNVAVSRQGYFPCQNK
jgi:hypothetical protein